MDDLWPCESLEFLFEGPCPLCGKEGADCECTIDDFEAEFGDELGGRQFNDGR